MHTSIRLASFTLAALVLGTSLASAGGFWDEIVEATKDDYKPPVTIKVNPRVKNNEEVNDAFGNKIAPKLPVTTLLDPAAAAVVVDVNGDVLALECRYADAGDLLLVNSGDVDLPAGAQVKWEIRSADLSGYLTFRSGFSAGAQFLLSDALASLDAAAPCAARAI